jgi:membrane associated rhomboid family serine protease
VFLPVGDSPNPKGVAWVNWTLIGLNVAVFLLLAPLLGQPADPWSDAAQQYLDALVREGRVAQEDAPRVLRGLSAYDLVVWEWGFHPARPSPLSLLAAMFLHGGLAHLLGNMLFLWIYGDNVEHHLGRVSYVVAYLGTGVAAAAGDALLRWGSLVPSVGASGAISGVLGCYFVWFPHNRVRVLAVLFPLWAGVVEVPARLVLGMYVLLDNLLPVLIDGGAGGVSHGAHIGGFAAGALLAWAVVRSPAAASPRVSGARTPGLASAFEQALASGRVDEAAELALGLPRSATVGRIDAAGWLELARRLEARGEARPALAAYERALGERDRWTAAAAHLGAARVLIAGGYPTAAYQHLEDVLDGAPTAAEAAEARRLLQVLVERTRSVPRRFGP